GLELEALSLHGTGVLGGGTRAATQGAEDGAELLVLGLVHVHGDVDAKPVVKKITLQAQLVFQQLFGLIGQAHGNQRIGGYAAAIEAAGAEAGADLGVTHDLVAELAVVAD